MNKSAFHKTMARESYFAYMQLLIDKAMVFFNNRVLTIGKELVVFDIDGTILDTTNGVPGMLDVYHGYPPMLKFYSTLLDLGYKIIFLTAREESFRETTLFNLEYCGYHTFDKLVMIPNYTMDLGKICAWKDEQRRIFKEYLGYHLVCCIGDQDADTKGDHIGEYQIRIPPLPFSTEYSTQCSTM